MLCMGYKHFCIYRLTPLPYAVGLLAFEHLINVGKEVQHWAYSQFYSSG